MADKPTAAEVQARQELDNAERLGADQSAIAARKRLAALGVDLEDAAAERSKTDAKPSRAPQGRQAPTRQTS